MHTIETNYYQVLGVRESATLDDIKRRYRELSKKYHPDTPGGDEKKMARINEAYAVLSDPVKRHFYAPPKPTATASRQPVHPHPQARHTAYSNVKSKPDVEPEQANGWAVFFAYIVAIPIAILLVSVLTPVANRFFTKATATAVTQPGNLAPTPISTNQSNNDDTTTTSATNAYPGTTQQPAANTQSTTSTYTIQTKNYHRNRNN